MLKFNKEEFIKILEKLKVNYIEDIVKESVLEKDNEIFYWEIYWTPDTASGEIYDIYVTYQVSFKTKIKRDKKLIELLQELKRFNIIPEVNIEVDQEKKYYHYYFSIEIPENIE